MRRRRVLAFAIDLLCMLGWVAVVAAVGVPLWLFGVITPTGPMARNPVVQNLVGLIVIIPVVVATAWWESRRGTTIGKRVLELCVEHAGARPDVGRALLRNILKLGLPWAIGHAAVFAVRDNSVDGASPVWTLWFLAAAYVVPLVWLGSLLAPGARTVYDRISSTDVRGA